MKIINPLIIGYELENINGKYLHIIINQRIQTPVVYIKSKSSAGYRIYQIRLTDEKVSSQDFLSNFKVGQRCRWCYFATDGISYMYISMDNSNSLECYEMNGRKLISIYIPSPSGIIIRNHDLWIVNSSQLIILSPTLLSDQTLTYIIQNQIDLSLLFNSPFTNPMIFSDHSTFMPFHLDVDNYGRIYISGALLDFSSRNNRHSPGNNQQVYILSEDQLGIPSAICAGPWGMFGINVYHSKLNLRMLTSSYNYVFNLYSTS